MLGRGVEMPELVDGGGYLAIVSLAEGKKKLALIQLPATCRFLTLPADRAWRVMFLDDVIHEALPRILSCSRRCT